MSLDFSPLGDFLEGLAGSTTGHQWLWQGGVGILAALLGLAVARVVCRRIRPAPRWRFGEGDFERVAVPLVILVFVWAGKFALEQVQPVPLLAIVQSLLLAWLVIRVAVYVLGHILPEGGFLRAVVRTIAWVAWIAVALHLVGYLGDVLDAMDNVGLTLGKDKQKLTLLLLLQALGALALTLTVAMWIARITETRVMASGDVEMSTRVVVAKLVRIVALFLAVLLALPMVGIDVTALSVFGGALGVGLGFGLQKIAANYVSGFIVLLDKSLRIGDVITIDGRRGEVKAIESRYTVIKAGGGGLFIVPNEKLISEIVNHHTYTDPRVAVPVDLLVAHDTDVERALTLALEAAGRQPRLLKDPAPAARVKRLPDVGIELEVVGWIENAGAGDADVKSDLFRDILRTFAANGIRLAPPRLAPATQQA